MRYLFVFLSLFLGINSPAQEIQVALIKTIPLKAEAFYGADTFGDLYYSTNSVLYKKTNTKTYQYANLALGNISSVAIYNPLEVVVFYSDFNTVIILDNTLNEIQKLSFLDKNISLAAKAGKNKLWLFNTDTQLLELYNYKTKVVESTSQPQSLLAPEEIKGNANDAWLKTKNKHLKQFNIYGSNTDKIDRSIGTFAISKSGLVVYESEKMLYLKSSKIQKISLKPSLNIKQLTLVDNKLYIFDGKRILLFKILKN